LTKGKGNAILENVANALRFGRTQRAGRQEK